MNYGDARGSADGQDRLFGRPGKCLPQLTRIDTPDELEDFKNGGILPYVLRGLLGE